MYSRGALECIHAVHGNERGEILCTEVVQRLMTACDVLRECSNGFTKLGYREQAAEAYEGCAHTLRLVSQGLLIINNVIYLIYTYVVYAIYDILNLTGSFLITFDS